MASPAILKIDILTDYNKKGMNQAQADLQSLGKGATIAAAAIGGALVVGATRAIGAASDLGESVNAVDKVFGSASGTIADFGRTAAESAGLSQREFNDLATRTGSLLTNFGYTAAEAADSTVGLATRAADMASVFNTDVGTALEAVNAGLRGESEPLRQFGVNLNDAALKGKALEMGLYDGTGALDANARALAAEALILEQTAAVAGDFADTSGSAANQQRTLQASMENLSAELGEVLLPYFESFLAAMGSAVEWAQKNQGAVKALVVVMASFSAVVLGVNVALKAYRAIALAVRVATIAWTYAQWAVNLAMTANPVGLIIVGIAALIAIVVLLVKNWDKVWTVMKRLWAWIRDAFLAVWDKIAGAIDNVIGKLRSAWDWIKKIIDSGVSKIPFIGRSTSLAGLQPSAARAAPAYAPVRGVTVNFNGLVTDPEGTARAVQRVLVRSAVRNARTGPQDRSW